MRAWADLDAGLIEGFGGKSGSLGVYNTTEEGDRVFSPGRDIAEIEGGSRKSGIPGGAGGG